MRSDLRFGLLIAFFVLTGLVLSFWSSDRGGQEPPEDVSKSNVSHQAPEPEHKPGPWRSESRPRKRIAEPESTVESTGPTEVISGELDRAVASRAPVTRRGLSIRGRVVDMDGDPVAEVPVYAQGDSKGSGTYSKADGSFTIWSVREGLYNVYTDSRKYTNAFRDGVQGGSGGLVLRLEPAVTVVGEVRTAGGEVLESFEVTLLKPEMKVNRYLDRASWKRHESEDGHFELEGAQGRVALRVAARAEGYLVKIARVSPVLPGEKSYPVSFRLVRGGEVRGHVTNRSGEPVPNATVFQYEGSFAHKLASSDAEGRFTVTGLEGHSASLVIRHGEYAAAAVDVALNPIQATDLEVTLE